MLDDLDGVMRALHIPKEARPLVRNAWRDWRGRRQLPDCPRLVLLPDCWVEVEGHVVRLRGPGTQRIFQHAVHVEQRAARGGYEPLRSCSAEELLQALGDTLVVAFRDLVQTAFREQSASHNALVLFSGQALGLMRAAILNRYLEGQRLEAAAQLLRELEQEQQQQQQRIKPTGGKGSKKQGGKRAPSQPARPRTPEAAAEEDGEPASPPLLPATPASQAAGGMEQHREEEQEWQQAHSSRRGSRSVPAQVESPATRPSPSLSRSSSNGSLSNQNHQHQQPHKVAGPPAQHWAKAVVRSAGPTPSKPERADRRFDESDFPSLSEALVTPPRATQAKTRSRTANGSSAKDG